MKWHLLSDSLFQSAVSAKRLISLAVQKEASAFLYILQMPLCWMGKRTKRRGFARRSGLGARNPLVSAVLCVDGGLGVVVGVVLSVTPRRHQQGQYCSVLTDKFLAWFSLTVKVKLVHKIMSSWLSCEMNMLHDTYGTLASCNTSGCPCCLVIVC